MKYTIDSHFTVIPAIGVEGFRSLKDDWDRLAMNNGSYFPFLSFDWFVTWLKHFPDTQLFIPVLYRNGAVAAIMPMERKTVNKRGIPLQVYAFAGNAYTQARAIIHDSTDPEERILQAEWLLSYFTKHAPDWDFLDLYGLQPENGNSEQIMEAARRCGLRYRRRVAYENCYQDGITLTADDYLKARPATVRKNAPYYRRKMQREGTLEFRLVKNDNNLDTIMDSYYQLYAKSWKKSEYLGPTFHRDLVRMAAAKGWLRLGFLDFNAEPIACQLWFVHDEAASVLKLFYDEKYKQYSPGTVLSESMLRTIMEQDKIRTLDYLQGADSYKFDWVDSLRTEII
ncbi:MAG: GNAT family N-acetyltransferase [Desulfuromonadaceae bacterium]|nr:GNAT family N-acetyltransferase [Desulfuromonadaceae bacterium]